MEYETMMFEACFQFENVPRFLQGILKDLFMERRNLAANIFNEYIEEVNEEWDKTGKLASFGNYLEDANSEYVKMIAARIQPIIDKEVNCGFPVEVYIGEYGDMYGRVVGLKDSKITLTLKEI